MVRNLLPSSAMIKDLSQEFGMPLSQEELTDEKLFALPPQPTPNLEDYHGRDSSLTLEIHAHQEKYLQWRSAMLLKNKDKKHSFIQVGRLPLQLGAPRPHLGSPGAC